jgi:hypothetical protein
LELIGAFLSQEYQTLQYVGIRWLSLIALPVTPAKGSDPEVGDTDVLPLDYCLLPHDTVIESKHLLQKSLNSNTCASMTAIAHADG